MGPFRQLAICNLVVNLVTQCYQWTVVHIFGDSVSVVVCVLSIFYYF